MLSRLSILLLLLILCACRIDDGAFQKLEGDWQYAVSSVSPRLTPEQIRKLEFQPLESPLYLAGLHTDKESIVFLKREFEVRNDIKGTPLSLLAGRIIWADRTYLNGQLLGETGTFVPQPTNAWNYTRYYPIEEGVLKPGQKNELIIEIYTMGEGALTDIPMLGRQKEIYNHYLLLEFFRVYLQMAISFTLLCFVLHYLLTYLKCRKNKEFLYFALFIFFFAAYNANLFLLSLPGLPLFPYLTGQKLIWLCIYLDLHFGVQFFRIFLERKTKKWEMIFIYSCIILSITVTLFAPDYETFIKVRGYTHLSIVVFALFCIYWTTQAWREGITKAYPIALSIALFLLPLAHDLVAFIAHYSVPFFFTSLAFPIFLYSVALTVATKYAATQAQLKKTNANLAYLNASLESRVQERNLELNQTLNKVQLLKNKQDGDYFLTSMLLNPFQVNDLHSKTIHINFLTYQKKRFSYQKYTADLGGDLCACHTIHLNNRPLTLFLAADAMGKSMQGAGGAIVLGSVFTAIITHTRRLELEQAKSPEEWLRSAYQEIHTVFCGFKGSMMVSMVLGLVDDETGLMHYINSDHPFPIFVYGNEIDFIENKITHYKAGTPGQPYTGTVRSYQMRDNESILLGSDGKDDLEIDNQDGNPIINSNNGMILDVLKNTGLDLPTIQTELERRGKLIDDLSLMAITYRKYTALEGNAPPVSS